MSVVYFLQRDAGEGPVKIGCSAYLDQRVRQLSSDLKAKLVVLATAPGTFRDEGRLHRQFAEHRGDGEWFAPAPEVMAAVAYARAKGVLPPPHEEDREIVMAARYLSGETLQSIGDEFGLTRERVRQLLRRSGVPSLGFRASNCRKAAPITDFERDLAAIYAEGLTPPAEICARFGISTGKLNTALARTRTVRFPMGHFRLRSDHDALVESCARLYREGIVVREIAERLGLKNQERVYPFLHEAGVELARLPRAKNKLEREAAAIIALYINGSTQAEIAERYGCSTGPVKALLTRHAVMLPAAEVQRRRMSRVVAANRARRRNSSMNAPHVHAATESWAV